MSAIDPGEGWRLLDDGEARQYGDELYWDYNKTWREWDDLYNNVQSKLCMPARRRITPMTAQPAPTEIEERVIAKMRERRERGRAKYGTTMERTDLKRLDWLRHAQEEAMDFAIYLERLIRDEENAP